MLAPAALLALTLAATASASSVMGEIKMFYDTNADCTGTALQSTGSTVAISTDSIDSCQRIPTGINDVPYKRFSATGLTPIYNFELYTDAECKQLATKESKVCVSDIQSYIPRRSN